MLSIAASCLLFLAALLAPWLGGARLRAEGPIWFLGGVLVAAFLLMCADRIREGRRPLIPAMAGWCVGILFGCLLWWRAQPEPDFATVFSAEHWDFLERWNPAGQLQLPRSERLFFLGSLLLGLLAAVDLGRKQWVRHGLFWAVSLSGMSVALYSIGQRWGGWAPPSWIYTSRGLDEFSSTFFNYSASAASLNFAWPWLVFGAWAGPVWLRAAAGAVALTIAGAALVAWPATSGWLVAAILLAGGGLWAGLSARFSMHARWILGGTALLFAVIFSWQGMELMKLSTQHPDGWNGAEMTRLTAEARDNAFRKAASARSDRLVSSSAPALPAVWTAGVRMAGDNWVIGDGPGSWVRRSALYSNDPRVNTFFHMRQFAHHDLLQTTAEWGVMPALVWLLLWMGGFYRSAQRNGMGRGDLALLLSLIGLAVHSLVHFPLQVPGLQIWAALMLGLAWSRNPRRRSQGAEVAPQAVTEKAST